MADMIFIPPRTEADLSKLAEPASEDIKNALQIMQLGKPMRLSERMSVIKLLSSALGKLDA